MWVAAGPDARHRANATSPVNVMTCTVAPAGAARTVTTWGYGTVTATTNVRVSVMQAASVMRDVLRTAPSTPAGQAQCVPTTGVCHANQAPSLLTMTLRPASSALREQASQRKARLNASRALWATSRRCQDRQSVYRVGLDSFRIEMLLSLATHALLDMFKTVLVPHTALAARKASISLAQHNLPVSTARLMLHRPPLSQRHISRAPNSPNRLRQRTKRMQESKLQLCQWPMMQAHQQWMEW
mmetsp:Transcript_48292/g.98613  ORF Transcript_48292/g.98613 Transcript_48292/m.98613 type:complete len:242 (-) Transcript_48292:1458-2183(-)